MVMQKVKRIYLFRRVGILGTKLVVFASMIGVTSFFVSFSHVTKNFIDVLHRGNVFLYISDAFRKTESVVLILSVLALVAFVAVIFDLRKMVAGTTQFAR